MPTIEEIYDESPGLLMPGQAAVAKKVRFMPWHVLVETASGSRLYRIKPGSGVFYGAVGHSNEATADWWWMLFEGSMPPAVGASPLLALPALAGQGFLFEPSNGIHCRDGIYAGFSTSPETRQPPAAVPQVRLSYLFR